MALLALVPTPIGNLDDITFRALEYLKTADCIYAEDTRQSVKLLQHFNIQKSLKPYHKFNEHSRLLDIVATIEANTMTVLISDAGTPGISDPGFLLVRECLKNNIEVICLPGATAFVPALVASGMPCDRFSFEGFLPHKKGRQTRIKNIIAENKTTVIYESPHRIVKLMEEFAQFIGFERQACVAREISKKFEEFKRGTLLELINYYKKNEPKGEIVFVIASQD